jgi:hypothetical protein
LEGEEEEPSLALDCLTAYRGDTVIHVGERFAQTLDENPWYGWMGVRRCAVL